jgi:NAD(P)-dependent dehydrogenase (short-subunit alcohol dehydrogenase family)
MKNVLIIGGSTGIGKATAELLSHTCSVFATYNHHETNHRDIKYFKYDVNADPIDLSQLPDSLDGFVYCPGSIQLKPINRISAEDFIQDYRLQVVGAIETIKAVLPLLKKSSSASIVLFSTVAVQTGFNFHSLVASSKGAIEGLTRSLAAELAPSIRVNAIAPSITQTPLASAILNTPEKIDANAQRHPLRRVGAAEDIANMVAFLVSDQSSWMTGQILHVDGGIGKLKV